MKKILNKIIQQSIIEKNTSLDYLIKIADTKSVCENCKLNCWFIKNYEEFVHWDVLSSSEHIDDEIAIKYYNRFYKSYSNLITNQKISEETLEYIDKQEGYRFRQIEWKILARCRKLSDNFIIKYLDRLPADELIKNQSMSDQTFSNVTNNYFGCNQLSILEDIYRLTNDEIKIGISKLPENFS